MGERMNLHSELQAPYPASCLKGAYFTSCQKQEKERAPQKNRGAEWKRQAGELEPGNRDALGCFLCQSTGTHQAQAQRRSQTARESKMVKASTVLILTQGPSLWEMWTMEVRIFPSHLRKVTLSPTWRNQCKGRENWQYLLQMTSSWDNPCMRTRE